MDITFILALIFVVIAVILVFIGIRKCSKGRWIGGSSDEDFMEERKEWRHGYRCCIVAVFLAFYACILLFGWDNTGWIFGGGLFAFAIYQIFKNPAP